MAKITRKRRRRRRNTRKVLRRLTKTQCSLVRLELQEYLLPFGLCPVSTRIVGNNSSVIC